MLLFIRIFECFGKNEKGIILGGIMKKYISLLLLCFVSISFQADDVSLKWSILKGTVNTDEATAVAVDNLGNVYMGGNTSESINGASYSGGTDIFLMKISQKDGTIYWTIELGTSDNEALNNIAVDKNGNIYIVGRTSGNFDGHTSFGSNDIILVKIDSNGNKLWSKQFGTANYDTGNGIAVDNSGNIYITGMVNDSLNGQTYYGGSDIFICKLNIFGDFIWTKQLGTTGDDWANDITLDSIGKYCYMAGTVADSIAGQISNGDYDGFLAQYNTDGVFNWLRLIGSNNFDEAWGVAVDSLENIYITGKAEGNVDDNINNGGADIFIAKYDPTGKKEWSKLEGTEYYDIGYSIDTDLNNNIYITGYTSGRLEDNTHYGLSDIFIIKYQLNGDRVLIKQFGTSDFDIGIDIKLSSPEYGITNIFIAGYSDGDFESNTNQGGDDALLCKWSTYEGFTSFDNLIVFPNPCIFNTSSKFITFKNLINGSIIKIYSISGVLVRELKPNNVSYQWDLKNSKNKYVGSGIYIFNIKADNLQKTGKIAIIK